MINTSQMKSFFTFFVINSESLFELLLEGLFVLLNQELGGQLTKFTELQKTWMIEAILDSIVETRNSALKERDVL